MKKIIILALLVGGVYYLKPGLFSFSNGAFDSDGQAQAWIFTFDGCGRHCDNARAHLARRAEYTEFNVSTEDGKQRLSEVGGGQQFPIILVGNRRVEGDSVMHIISALAEGLGPEILTPIERRVMQGHFYEDGTPAVVMYGAQWCGYCKQMREYFKSNNVEFIELDAETQAKTHYAALKGGGYPLIYVGYRRIEGANMRLFEQTMKDLKL